jgi:hypothetical protein
MDSPHGGALWRSGELAPPGEREERFGGLRCGDGHCRYYRSHLGPESASGVLLVWGEKKNNHMADFNKA